MGRPPKQDARLEHAALDLDEYDAEAMAADLGQQRHDALPLSGAPGRAKTPPPPDPKKLGKAGLKLAKKVESTIAAWESLYDPDLDEKRDDGLGSGQAHRTGVNFRPTGGVMARMGGHGRGGPQQRTRSMSPPPGRGRGRGRTLDLGSRPPPQIRELLMGRGRGGSEAKFNNEPLTYRSIKPRVNQRAMDDFVIPPARNTRADPSDPIIGHWFSGRLAVNKDNLEFFQPRQTPTKISVSSPFFPDPLSASIQPESPLSTQPLVEGAVEKAKSIGATHPSQLQHPNDNANPNVSAKAPSGLMESIYAPKPTSTAPTKQENSSVGTNSGVPAAASGLMQSIYAPKPTRPPPAKPEHLTPLNTTISKFPVSTGAKSPLVHIPLQRISTNSSMDSSSTKPPPHLQKTAEVAKSSMGQFLEQHAANPKSLTEVAERIEILTKKKDEANTNLRMEQEKLGKVEHEMKELQHRLETLSASAARIKSGISTYTGDILFIRNAINVLQTGAAEMEKTVHSEKAVNGSEEKRYKAQVGTGSQRQENARLAELPKQDQAREENELHRQQVGVNHYVLQPSDISALTSVPIAPPSVAPVVPAPADKNDIFQRNNESSFSEIDELDQDTSLFPFIVKVVLRPVIDRDTLTVKLASTDIPSRRIKKDLKKYLQSEADYKTLEMMPAFESFIFRVSSQFFKRISKTYD